MKKIKKQPSVKKKELRFYHKHNRYFTGYLLKESQDFYTIELTCDVAGLNGIWYAKEVVMWSTELTSIVDTRKKAS